MAKPMATLEERERTFWSRVQKDPDGCWIWQGAHYPHGYGHFWHGGRDVYTHRFAWEITHGEIPDGAHVCHHCDVRDCVNPAHLFLGSRSDNMKDTFDKGRLSHCFEPQDECANGHLIEGDNAIVDRRGFKACRECRRAYKREWNRSEKARAYKRAWRARRKERGLPYV